jgi:hypothetical protein
MWPPPPLGLGLGAPLLPPPLLPPASARSEARAPPASPAASLGVVGLEALPASIATADGELQGASRSRLSPFTPLLHYPHPLALALARTSTLPPHSPSPSPLASPATDPPPPPLNPSPRRHHEHRGGLGRASRSTRLPLADARVRWHAARAESRRARRSAARHRRRPREPGERATRPAARPAREELVLRCAPPHRRPTAPWRTPAPCRPPSAATQHARSTRHSLRLGRLRRHPCEATFGRQGDAVGVAPCIARIPRARRGGGRRHESLATAAAAHRGEACASGGLVRAS